MRSPPQNDRPSVGHPRWTRWHLATGRDAVVEGEPEYQTSTSLLADDETDGTITQAPSGGEVAGSESSGGKQGMKWSVAAVACDGWRTAAAPPRHPHQRSRLALAPTS